MSTLVGYETSEVDVNSEITASVSCCPNWSPSRVAMFRSPQFQAKFIIRDINLPSPARDCGLPHSRCHPLETVDNSDVR